ncbi:hypothetical protein RRG08_023677 [Elysia crispata]|uniref:Smr domain-containing protein n=1 Tax=Elysia crispata TaxID=231223 RepID=A0AAE1ALD3_9GAST|nr:hypothetical protein RRG08_023677 [Elysia crispata]
MALDPKYIGIIFGCIAGAIILLILFICLFLCIRKRSREHQERSQQQQQHDVEAGHTNHQNYFNSRSANHSQWGSSIGHLDRQQVGSILSTNTRTSRRDDPGGGFQSDRNVRTVRSKSSVDTGRNRRASRGRQEHIGGRRDQSCPGRQNQRIEVFPGQKKYAEISSDGKTIDLHHLSQQDAFSETVNFLKQKENEYIGSGRSRQDRFLTIITGQGKHSKDKIPVLKPMVEEYLTKTKFWYKPVEDNPGRLKIDLYKSQL